MGRLLLALLFLASCRAPEEPVGTYRGPDACDLDASEPAWPELGDAPGGRCE